MSEVMLDAAVVTTLVTAGRNAFVREGDSAAGLAAVTALHAAGRHGDADMLEYDILMRRMSDDVNGDHAAQTAARNPSPLPRAVPPASSAGLRAVEAALGVKPVENSDAAFKRLMADAGNTK